MIWGFAPTISGNLMFGQIFCNYGIRHMCIKLLNAVKEDILHKLKSVCVHQLCLNDLHVDVYK